LIQRPLLSILTISVINFIYHEEQVNLHFLSMLKVILKCITMF